ncbi:cell adhesion molecule CEACAM19 isoform 2-T2 [Dugong dugon]
MEISRRAQGCFSKDRLLSGLKRPQRDGSAMRQRDIVGFSNGSMLLRRAQPSDSGIYHVAVTINPSWTMKAKTEVQVAEKEQKLPSARLPVNIGIMAAIIIGSLTAGALLISSLAYLLVTRGWKGQNHGVSPPGGQRSLSVLVPAVSPVPATVPNTQMTHTEKPEVSPDSNAGDNNIYEVMPSPGLLVSPLSDTGLVNSALPPPLPPPLQLELENHHYQDLLNPDPAPYCQLVPAPRRCSRPGQAGRRPRSALPWGPQAYGNQTADTQQAGPSRGCEDGLSQRHSIM